MNDDKKEITKKNSSGKTTSGNSRKKQKDGGIAEKEAKVDDAKKECTGKSSNGKTTKVLESSSINNANENMDSNESESNPNESSDRLCKIRTYTPKYKPATKTLTGQVQKFFKENEPVRRLCTYTLGKNINCRVLEERGPESFMNIDNKYYMFNHEDQSLKDFGDIFEIGIDSMMDVPWSE